MTPAKGPAHNYNLSHADRLCLTCPLPGGCHEANPLCQRQAWLRTQGTRKRPLIRTQVMAHLTITGPLTIPDLARAIDRKPASVHSAVRQLLHHDILATIPPEPEPGRRYIKYYMKETSP